VTLDSQLGFFRYPPSGATGPVSVTLGLTPVRRPDLPVMEPLRRGPVRPKACYERLR